MHFINNAFVKNIIFNSNLRFKISVLDQFPTFYTNILQSCKRIFSHITYTPGCTGSQFLWLNNCITMDKISVHYKKYLSHNIKFMNQLFTFEEECEDSESHQKRISTHR